MTTPAPSRSAARAGYLLAIAGTASLSAVSVISKLVFRSMNRETFLPILYLGGFALTVVYMALTGTLRGLRVPRRLWLWVLLVGALYSIGAFCYYWGIQVASPALASFFGRMQTVYTILWSVMWMRERLGRREVVGMVLTLGGALIITYAGGSRVWQAFLIALIGESLFNSLGFISSKLALQRGVPPAALSGYRSLVMCLLNAAYTTARGVWMPPPSGALWLTVAGAFFGPFLTWVLIMHALSRADAAKVAIIRNLLPAFVVLYSVAVLGTLPTPRQLAGGALTIAGVVILLWAHGRGSAS